MLTSGAGGDAAGCAEDVLSPHDARSRQAITAAILPATCFWESIIISLLISRWLDPPIS